MKYCHQLNSLHHHVQSSVTLLNFVCQTCENKEEVSRSGIDTHIGHIQRRIAIWQYGHIVSDIAIMRVNQESYANLAIWSRGFIDYTFQWKMKKQIALMGYSPLYILKFPL